MRSNLRLYVLTRISSLKNKEDILKQVGALPALVLDPSDEVDRLSKSHSEMFRDRTCYGRTIAAHLPFRGIDPICRDPFIRSYASFQSYRAPLCCFTLFFRPHCHVLKLVTYSKNLLQQLNHILRRRSGSALAS